MYRGPYVHKYYLMIFPAIKAKLIKALPRVRQAFICLKDPLRFCLQYLSDNSVKKNLFYQKYIFFRIKSESNRSKASEKIFEY